MVVVVSVVYHAANSLTKVNLQEFRIQWSINLIFNITFKLRLVYKAVPRKWLVKMVKIYVTQILPGDGRYITKCTDVSSVSCAVVTVPSVSLPL